MLPTVRSAGMSTEGDGWLLQTTTRIIDSSGNFREKYVRRQGQIEAKEHKFKTVFEGRFRSYTAITPQVDDRRQPQSRPESCHSSHRINKIVPSKHP